MQLTTISGKNFFDVSSAFQKAVRRGEEEAALHWGFEFYNSGYSKYAWKRLIYMVSEDIGLANPTLPATIMALKSAWDWDRKENISAEGRENKEGSPAEKLIFLHALLLCVRSPKSRVVDNVLGAAEEDWRKNYMTMEIPDYAYGMFTQQGKAQGRGHRHFFEQEAILNPIGKVPGEQEWEARALEYGEFRDANRGKWPSEMPDPEAGPPKRRRTVVARKTTNHRVEREQPQLF